MRIIFIITFVFFLPNAHSFDWSQACDGVFPYSFRVGNGGPVARTPQLACKLYGEEWGGGNQTFQQEGVGYQLYTNNNGIPYCAIISYRFDGNLYGAEDIRPICNEENAISCAESTGFGYARFTSGGSTSCENRCSMQQVGPAMEANGQSVAQYGFTGISCDETPPPVQEDDGIALRESDPNEVCIVNSAGEVEVEQCVNHQTNCGSWSYTDDSGSVQNMQGCLDSAPPPNQCAETESSDLGCHNSLTESPPLPDTGIPGQVPTPALVLEYQDGNTINYWDQTSYENSTVQVTVGSDLGGGDPGGGDPGDGGDTDPQTEPFECTDEWFCEPPPEPQDVDYEVEQDHYAEKETDIMSTASSTVSPYGTSIETIGLTGWAASSGGPCLTPSYDIFGAQGVFDGHCQVWNDYLRPLIGFFLYVATALYILSEFRSTTTRQ